MNYPVFEGSVTAVKLGEWILLAAGMASLVAATFSALTEWLVINPLENRIQEATAESPLSESSEGSGSAEDVQVETQTKHTVEETLNQLGYDVQLSETQEETDDDSNEV